MKLIKLAILLLSVVVINTKATNEKAATEKVATETKKTALKGKGVGGLTDILPDSVTYGYASSDNYILQHAAGFIDAEILPKIPIHLNKPYTGVMGEARGFITDRFYYNGSDNLSAIHIDCNVYSTNPQQCVHNSKCGWCGEKDKCIAGSLSGPLSPCLRNTFLYVAPTPEWTPFKAGTINILATDKQGKPQNVITWEPNLKKTDIFNPYM